MYNKYYQHSPAENAMRSAAIFQSNISPTSFAWPFQQVLIFKRMSIHTLELIR